MHIFDELKERGLIFQTTDEEALRQELEEGQVSYYTGYDPTADSLHLGHLVAILTSRRLQLVLLFIGVGQYFVSLVYLFKFFFGFFITLIFVRMIFQCQLSVSRLDLGFVCRFRYAENFIIIALCHFFSSLNIFINIICRPTVLSARDFSPKRIP